MDHARFMRLALRLAKKGVGLTSPNPAVGALIVKGGAVIGKGYHKKAGGPHAEINALSSCQDPMGATLYVTLEPCCHFGKTPPCVDAVISSGIKRAVIGMKDPNPLVAGKGIKKLRSAGIEVISGIIEDECRAINEPFIKFITAGMPFVTLKLAMSLDGKIAAYGGDSRWITGIEARGFVHRLRSVHDAVLVGSSTVLADDPELTVRLVKGKSPRRVLADSSFKAPLAAKALRKGLDERSPIVLTTEKARPSKIKKARAMGIETLVLPASKDGIDLKKGLKELGKMGITSVLAEGGGSLAASLVKNRLVDKVLFFYAPVIIGSEGVSSVGTLGVKAVKNAFRLKGAVMKKFGADFLIEGYF